MSEVEFNEHTRILLSEQKIYINEHELTYDFISDYDEPKIQTIIIPEYYNDRLYKITLKTIGVLFNPRNPISFFSYNLFK